jgi:uncharacterized protein YndB with AHSA1/START domain
VEARKGKQTTMAEQAITGAILMEASIEQDITIQAPREDVFDALTQEISAWWGPPYVHSSGAKGLVLEPQVGGRLYEDLGAEEGLLLATVVFIKRPNELRMIGSMGLPGLVQGVIQFQFEPKDEGTLLKLSHRMMGEVGQEIRTAYDGGWQMLLETRLRNFVEHGTRYDLAPEVLPEGPN